ncbi:diguanylate cyclase [Candidatus Omnitrophota bacterium]
MKQKKLLFNSYPLLGIAFAAHLCFFAFYAHQYQPSFTKSIVGAYLALCIIAGIIFKRYQSSGDAVLRDMQDVYEEINILSDTIMKNNHKIESLHSVIMRYRSLKGLTERLSKGFDTDDTIQILVEETARLIKGRGNTYLLFLHDKEKNKLSMEAMKHVTTKETVKAKQGDIFDSWILSKMQPLIVEDAKKDFRFDFERIAKEYPRKVRSLISVPLIIGKDLVGIMRIDNTKECRFNAEDLRLLSTVSDLGAIAIENAQLYQRTKELSIKDGLTGLYLRRYFFDRLEQEFKRALASDLPLSLLMIDIDDFKVYNDKFGHIAGDLLLQHIGKTLLKQFDKAGNIVCRYGGEEFAVLLVSTTKKEALRLAERLRSTIKETKIQLRKKFIPITVSIGVSAFPEDARLKEVLIQASDSALYRAKKAGKDKVCSS